LLSGTIQVKQQGSVRSGRFPLHSVKKVSQVTPRRFVNIAIVQGYDPESDAVANALSLQ
jgi:hypothetical protein